MQAKVLAPPRQKQSLEKLQNDVAEYDYDKLFGTYHTSAQIAAFLLDLYDSDKVVGLVDRKTFLSLMRTTIQYAGNSQHNQKM